LQNFT